MCQFYERQVQTLTSAILTELDQKNIPFVIGFSAIQRVYLTLLAEVLEEDDFDHHMKLFKIAYQEVKKESAA